MKQWVSEKGLDASFLDRHAVLQQVLNTMAAIHNSGNDKSLWGCFMGEWREKEREREREMHMLAFVLIYAVPCFPIPLECTLVVDHIHRGVDCIA